MVAAFGKWDRDAGDDPRPHSDSRKALPPKLEWMDLGCGIHHNAFNCTSRGRAATNICVVTKKELDPLEGH